MCWFESSISDGDENSERFDALKENINERFIGTFSGIKQDRELYKRYFKNLYIPVDSQTSLRKKEFDQEFARVKKAILWGQSIFSQQRILYWREFHG